MDKETKINRIIFNNKNIDFSQFRLVTTCIKEFVESDDFENELKASIERQKQRHHKNIVSVLPDDEARMFLFCLPYLCFVPMEILVKNDYLSGLIQKHKLDILFYSLDELQQRILELPNVVTFIVDLKALTDQVVKTMVWNFYNEFMTPLGLGKNTRIDLDTITGKRKIDIVIKPLSKIQKSWKDSLHQIKMKQASGEPIVGQNQQGWLRVSEAFKQDAYEFKIKDFNLENNINELGKVSQGLIPNSLKHLDIFVVGKPSRSDTRLVYDHLRFFYNQINPLDNNFESLNKRLEGLGNDEKMKAKETSDYYEFLGRKMRRYFGIEFTELS